MNAEQYLSQTKKYWDLFLKSKFRLQELDEKKGPTVITLDKIKVQSSPTDDPIVNLIHAINEEKKRCNEYYDKYLNLWLEQSATINRLDNRIYAEILIRKYLKMETDEQIAKKMHYSQQHVNRLRKDALDDFQRLLNKIYV